MIGSILPTGGRELASTSIRGNTNFKNNTMYSGSTRLYVGRLAPAVTRDDIADLFKNVGVRIKAMYLQD